MAELRKYQKRRVRAKARGKYHSNAEAMVFCFFNSLSVSKISLFVKFLEFTKQY